ncbi:MAG TPA: hypothetical protein VN867_09900 [Candidatus Binataceae bacterium]|nr:hypothetical protein [Candidatus Binataceae bacterium]
MTAIVRLILAVAFAVLAAASTAFAAEPRPWLCRDKPVFSSQQPMRYELKTNSRWHLFLMEFSPGGGHDGFDIAKEIAISSKGSLAAGRYFAVALHNAGGRWICPSEVSEQPTGAGVISNLCFAEGESGCAAKFTVRPDVSAATPPVSP